MREALADFDENGDGMTTVEEQQPSRADDSMVADTLYLGPVQPVHPIHEQAAGESSEPALGGSDTLIVEGGSLLELGCGGTPVLGDNAAATRVQAATRRMLTRTVMRYLTIEAAVSTQLAAAREAWYRQMRLTDARRAARRRWRANARRRGAGRRVVRRGHP